MSGKFFLDTNVFVYSFDARHPSKQKTAQGLIDKALSSHGGLVSYQVVQEFLNVALKKFEKPLTLPEARAYLDAVLEPLCRTLPAIQLYQRALELKGETGFGFYDCLVLASALETGCRVLYTEDLHHQRRVGGLTIQNPF